MEMIKKEMNLSVKYLKKLKKINLNVRITVKMTMFNKIQNV